MFISDPRDMLWVGTPPRAEIQQGDWLDFVLPQIAFRAAQMTFRYPGAATADRLEAEFAWKLEEYDKMGLP